CFDPAQSRALAFFSIPFFQQPAPTDIYSLSLHDALPIWHAFFMERGRIWTVLYLGKWPWFLGEAAGSVLQSPFDWQMQGRMWLSLISAPGKKRRGWSSSAAPMGAAPLPFVPMSVLGMQSTRWWKQPA